MGKSEYSGQNDHHGHEKLLGFAEGLSHPPYGTKLVGVREKPLLSDWEPGPANVVKSKVSKIQLDHWHTMIFKDSYAYSFSLQQVPHLFLFPNR